MPHHCPRFWLIPLILAIGLPASRSAASTYYTINVQGAENFLTLDPLSGVTTPIPPLAGLGAGSWNGLAELPGNDDFLYAVNNPRPPTFDDPQTSRLARIDRHTGEVTTLPLFDEDTLGFDEPFSTAIVISPFDKSRAIIAGFATRIPGARYLWQVDIGTGTVLGPGVPVEGAKALRSMTFDPTGEKLYALDETRRLVVVDPATGMLDVVGDTGLTANVEGLAFNPYTSRLLAIEGGLQDRLLELDPANGSVLNVIGPVGIAGPEGLVIIPLTGDANGDMVVDLLDFGILKSNFGMGDTLAEADFNRDFLVDLNDFNILKANFGAGAGGSPVPEPGTFTLCTAAMGLLAFAAFRWRLTHWRNKPMRTSY
jgi:hypothetical protein